MNIPNIKEKNSESFLTKLKEIHYTIVKDCLTIVIGW